MVARLARNGIGERYDRKVGDAGAGCHVPRLNQEGRGDQSYAREPLLSKHDAVTHGAGGAASSMAVRSNDRVAGLHNRIDQCP